MRGNRVRWRKIFQPPKSSENRPSLSSSSLNSIMCIKLRQIPITHFHNEFSDKIRETKGNHRRSHAKNLTLPNLFSMIPAQMIMMTLVLQIVVMMM